MQVFVGYDNGNGNQDICSSYHKEVIDFPSVTGEIGKPSVMEGAKDEEKYQHMSVLIGERHIGIGDMAIRNAKICNHDVTNDKYTSDQSLLLARTGIFLVTPELLSNVKMVLGLPYYKMAEANEIANRYKGLSHGLQVGFYGKYQPIKSLMVEEVLPVPQHYGTMFDLVLDDNGEIADKDLILSHLAVYDIGFKTNMGAVFHMFNPVERYNIHSKNGMYLAFEQIATKVSQSFNGLEVKAYQVPMIIRSGGVVQGVNISTIINDALFTLALNIVNEIKARWGDAWEISKTAFTGGGAVLLKPYLEQAFKDAVFKDNKTTANGLRKYAVRKWGRAS